MNEEKPHPPGDYPVVVLGSGPGGLQVSYTLSQLGIRHAVLSADDAPGGMFRKFPLFQRLISWSKPYAPVDSPRGYEWFDWNSLIAQPQHQAPAREFMDGTSVFPRREEMEASLVAFADRANVKIRYECTWESTTRTDNGFILHTTDGDYSCRVPVFALGMTQPWKPADIEGMDLVPHYADVSPPKHYDGKRVFIIGKGNSGFEIADGLLPYTRQLIICSPRPAKISILTRSTAAARARYLQPYEDFLLAGGTIVLDAQPRKVEKTDTGFRVTASGTTRPGDLMLDVDEVIVATGFSTPLRDLPDLGVATFFREGLLPAQTAFWESPSVPGIFFAGSIGQGSIGLKKYGRPASSGSVHGIRYNARVLAAHIAETRFDIPWPRREIKPTDVVDLLLQEATHGPELWNQHSYLTRVVTLDRDKGILDEGIMPLAHFVDSGGADAVAVAIETDAEGLIHPALYLKHSGRVDEHLLEPDPFQNYLRAEYRGQVEGFLKDFLN